MLALVLVDTTGPVTVATNPTALSWIWTWGAAAWAPSCFTETRNTCSTWPKQPQWFSCVRGQNGQSSFADSTRCFMLFHAAFHDVSWHRLVPRIPSFPAFQVPQVRLSGGQREGALALAVDRFLGSDLPRCHDGNGWTTAVWDGGTGRPRWDRPRPCQFRGIQGSWWPQRLQIANLSTDLGNNMSCHNIFILFFICPVIFCLRCSGSFCKRCTKNTPDIKLAPRVEVRF